MKNTEKFFFALSFAALCALPAEAQELSTAAVWSPDAFAFDLYRELSGSENFMFSPLSAGAAFSMAYEGAAGATRKDFAGVFRFPADGRENREYFRKLAGELNFSGPEGEMTMVNSFWAHKDYPFLPAFLASLRDNYSAEAENLDFANKTEEARKKINDWAGAKTKGRIKGVLPPRSINALTRLVLVNAVYFKGFWENKFDKGLTYRENFMKSEKEKKQVMMMKSSAPLKARYAETEYSKLLELPYKGKRFSILILLPPAGEMKKLEKALTAENLAEWEKNLYEKKVKVFLPRFRLEYLFNLHEILPAMGMKIPFTQAADFSGMDGKKDLYIQKAFQKTFLEINEEGSEAAAATAAVVGLKSIMINPVFKADSPFIFLIRDLKSGSIIFMGKVSDPESK